MNASWASGRTAQGESVELYATTLPKELGGEVVCAATFRGKQVRAVLRRREVDRRHFAVVSNVVAEVDIPGETLLLIDAITVIPTWRTVFEADRVHTLAPQKFGEFGGDILVFGRCPSCRKRRVMRAAICPLTVKRCQCGATMEWGANAGKDIEADVCAAGQGSG